MIRFLFRFIGLWLLAGAFVALVIDGTRSVSASRFIAASVRDIWSLLDPAGLAAAQKSFAGAVSERTLELFLGTPFFIFLALGGALFLLIGRRREARGGIGYSSRR
jgi:hypothetical protein